jgi:hypothetical protein
MVLATDGDHGLPEYAEDGQLASPVLTSSWRPLSVALASVACGDSPEEARTAARAAARTADAAASHTPPPTKLTQTLTKEARHAGPTGPPAPTPAEKKKSKHFAFTDTPDPRWLAGGREASSYNSYCPHVRDPDTGCCGICDDTDYALWSADEERSRPWQGPSDDDFACEADG